MIIMYKYEQTGFPRCIYEFAYLVPHFTKSSYTFYVCKILYSIK